MFCIVFFIAKYIHFHHYDNYPKLTGTRQHSFIISRFPWPWVQSQFSWVICCFTRLKFRCGSGLHFFLKVSYSELTDYWLNSALCGCRCYVPIFPLIASQHLLSTPREPEIVCHMALSQISQYGNLL